MHQQLKLFTTIKQEGTKNIINLVLMILYYSSTMIDFPSLHLISWVLHDDQSHNPPNKLPQMTISAASK